VELRKKIEWYKKYYPKGLRIKAILSKKAGYQGMLEYIPGKYAHRPVEAEGYMFIHCIFVGFKKEYKGKGLASSLLDECIKDAQKKKMLGVAVVTRHGSFMARKEIFLKKGFKVVDTAKPDFELLVKKFNEKSINPRFKPNMTKSLKRYQKGLYVIRSPQCPYTEKNVNAIIKSAKNKFNLQPHLIDLKDSNDVQDTPCAFGTFCIIYDGEIISHHPISHTRFENIMKKMI
jgi:N-acetylglutamate synthase-like GNAT family acetyltransferase